MTKEEKSREKKTDFEEKDYVKWLFELGKKDISIAGGKGANLAEMFNSRFPVPPAFVITAQAYEKFILNIKDEIEKIIEETDIDDVKQLNEASKKIRAMIEKQNFSKNIEAEILEAYETLGTEKQDGAGKNALAILKSAKEPEFVAVRSSATTEDLATASFAGQQETFLNVKGKSKLLSSIKKCFSSLYTARAIYYREKRGFAHEKALIAVIVQKMINSDKSGVIFSRDPVKKSDNVVIEAVFGLGEGVVSGKIKPDQYVISRNFELLDENISNKKIALVKTLSGEIETMKLTEEKSKSQVLTKSQINELAGYALDLEKHYKKSQDIEFAIESGKIYIVQTRPITTSVKDEGREIEGKVILQGMPASPGIASGKAKIIHHLKDLDKITKGDILVTEMTNPDMVVTMQKSSAIITDEGGMTSHAAIVSREMGIPCVVGTESATKILKEEMMITIEGNKGKIYEGKVGEIKKAEILPVVKTETKIKVILDLPDFAERASRTQAKDVGLLRLEGIIASSGKHPLMFLAEGRMHSYTEMLEKGIEKIAKYFKSTWIRTSDIRTDEFKNLSGAPKHIETNPMLGFHGIRFSLKNKEILESELFAIKKVADKFPDKEFGVMFPQVISVQEVKQAKKIFEKFKNENIKIGIMVETPAACEIISELCDEGIDFISFGTNDLTQFTLAVDRGNENVQYLYNEMNPAVLSQIKRVISVCKEKGVETSICGQAASEKPMVEFLVSQGIDSISVNADAAHEISKLVQELESKSSAEEKAFKEPETLEQESEKMKEQIEQEAEEEAETTEAEEELEESAEQPEQEESEKEPEEIAEEISEDKKEQKASEKEEEKAEEFPDIEIGFDVFSGGEKKAEIENIDDTSDVEKEIEEKVEEVEQEKEERAEENKEVEESIEIEPAEPESVEEEQAEEEAETTEVEEETEEQVVEEDEISETAEELESEEEPADEEELEKDEDILDIF